MAPFPKVPVPRSLLSFQNSYICVSPCFFSPHPSKRVPSLNCIHFFLKGGLCERFQIYVSRQDLVVSTRKGLCTGMASHSCLLHICASLKRWSCHCKNSNKGERLSSEHKPGSHRSLGMPFWQPFLRVVDVLCRDTSQFRFFSLCLEPFTVCRESYIRMLKIGAAKASPMLLKFFCASPYAHCTGWTMWGKSLSVEKQQPKRWGNGANVMRRRCQW